jgi:hypothetical protein
MTNQNPNQIKPFTQEDIQQNPRNISHLPGLFRLILSLPRPLDRNNLIENARLVHEPIPKQTLGAKVTDWILKHRAKSYETHQDYRLKELLNQIQAELNSYNYLCEDSFEMLLNSFENSIPDSMIIEKINFVLSKLDRHLKKTESLFVQNIGKQNISNPIIKDSFSSNIEKLGAEISQLNQIITYLKLTKIEIEKADMINGLKSFGVAVSAILLSTLAPLAVSLESWNPDSKEAAREQATEQTAKLQPEKPQQAEPKGDSKPEPTNRETQPENKSANKPQPHTEHSHQ